MNSKLRTSINLSAIVMVLGLTGGAAYAAANASDTAANYVVSGWGTTPPNLGTGFGPWANQAVNNNSPPYSGTYLDQTSYNNSDGVLSGGYAWGTYANGSPGNGAFILSRPFTVAGGTANLLNQTFSIGLGSKSLTSGTIGLNVGSAFSLSYVGGGPDNFMLSVDGGAGTVVPITAAQLNLGILVSLSVSGPLNAVNEGYQLAISPFAGGAPLFTQGGTFNSSAYDTASFTFTDTNTSGDQFVNNPTIVAVPEPCSLALLGMGAFGVSMRYRHGKKARG
jgi:hypothetical protein